MKTPINLERMHQEFGQLQELADRFSAQFDALEQGDLGWHLWEANGASPYCERQHLTVRALSRDLWFLRLALAWDSLPQRRSLVLRACREQLQAVAATFSEWIQEHPASLRDLILPEYTKASELLLRPAEEITTEKFIEGMTLLAKLVGLSLGPQEEDLSPGQQFWGVREAMIGMCKRLYALLVPSAKEG